MKAVTNGDGRAYLDYVPVRISVDNAEGRYHVPLISTPWSYSTYRGT